MPNPTLLERHPLLVHLTPDQLERIRRAIDTPKLLMLSGIGPPEVLRAHGIEPRVPLPGVGTNLRDRYEVGVVNRMNMKAWGVYQGATFDDGGQAEHVATAHEFEHLRVRASLLVREVGVFRTVELRRRLHRARHHSEKHHPDQPLQRPLVHHQPRRRRHCEKWA